jgi:hypothetical protein
VAATGLLGFNPYGKSVALDISSKPTQLAIQLEQKEQAKKEALDKYLMDYEKSINPAGMRKVESDIFLKKLADNKAFYIQNRDKILNPAKYGYDAQSQYMSNFKDMTNIIDQSKQAAAQDKLATQHFIAQKDLNAPDGYAEALAASHLPITDPRYRPLDVTQYSFYKSHDPVEYANKVFSKIPLSESAPEILDVKDRPGYIYSKTISKIAPQNYGRVLQDGYNSFETDEGLRKTVINMFDDKKRVKELELKYNTKIPTAKALAGIYTLDLQPIKENTTNAVESGASREARARRNIDYSNQNQAPTTHLFDIFGSGTGLTTKNADIKDGIARKKDGSLYDGNIVIPKEQLPSDFSAALSSAGISKNDLDATEYLTVNYKDGKATSVSSETLGTIDANQMARYQDALNKRIYGVKGAITRTTAPPAGKSDSNTSGEIITKAKFLKMTLSDRQKFLNNGGTYK